VIFADGLLRRRGVPCVGVSTAWSLVVHILQMRPEDQPAWIADLVRNRDFAHALLAEDMELARDLMRRYIGVVDMFAAVVTNFFSLTTTDHQCITSLGRRSSRVNHSSENANVRNVIMTDPITNRMIMAWQATRDIPAGTELLFDYGADYADRMHGCNDPPHKVPECVL
jgi:hypothetical protein